MPIGAIIGGVSAIGGALINKKASDNAAKASSKAASVNAAILKDVYKKSNTASKIAYGNANKANNYAHAQGKRAAGWGYTRNNGLNTDARQNILQDNRQAFDRTNALYQNFKDAGDSAHAAMAYENGLGVKPAGYGGFMESAGYQFQQQQGEKAIDRAAASRGNYYGSSTIQALNKFNNGLADQEYSDHYNRLSGLSSAGMQATGAMANAAQILAQNDVGAEQSYAANQVANTSNYTNQKIDLSSQYAANKSNNSWNLAGQIAAAGNVFSGGSTANNNIAAQASSNAAQSSANAINGGINNLMGVYGGYKAGAFN